MIASFNEAEGEKTEVTLYLRGGHQLTGKIYDGISDPTQEHITLDTGMRHVRVHLSAIVAWGY